jgi:hypothetical protein
MGIGHWALGIGHWALGIGHWLLILLPHPPHLHSALNVGRLFMGYVQSTIFELSHA